MTEFPMNFLVRIGGVVTAHSVKLLDKIHNPGMVYSELITLIHIL